MHVVAALSILSDNVGQHIGSIGGEPKGKRPTFHRLDPKQFFACLSVSSRNDIFYAKRLAESLRNLRGSIGFLGGQSITHHRDGAPDGFNEKTSLVKRNSECGMLTAFKSEEELGDAAV